MGKILSAVGAGLFLLLLFVPVMGPFSLYAAITSPLIGVPSWAVLLVALIAAVSGAMPFLGKAKLGGILGLIPLLIVLAMIVMGGAQMLTSLFGILFAVSPVLMVVGGFMAGGSSSSSEA